jgi:hypothetical protein
MSLAPEPGNGASPGIVLLAAIAPPGDDADLESASLESS